MKKPNSIDKTVSKTRDKKSRSKSRAEIFKERENEIGIPDFSSSFNKQTIQDIEKKIFQTPIKFAKVKDSADGRVCISDSDDNCPIIPNEPQYIGFRQPEPNRYTSIPAQIVEHFGSRVHFIGFQACAFLAEHNFIYKACMMPGEDALSCGYEIIPRGGKEKKMMSIIEDAIDDKDFGLYDSLKRFEFNKRCFGFGFAIPCFEEGIYDEQTNPKGVRMDLPLIDYTQLKDKRFIGWSIIDPYWLTPEFDENSERNPAYKDYFKPTWWRVNGRGCSIHKSWAIHINNTMMADITSPTYLWGGISIPQLCYERVYAADKCANEAPMVALSKRLLAITNCNVRKMAGNSEYAKRQINNLEFARNNWGFLILDRNQDIKQVDTMISEFNQTITTQYQLFCGIVEIPTHKMMMSPLTGFANSGDYEWKIYAANQKKIQDYEYNHILKMTARIIAATMGKDIRFDVKWGEVDIPTMEEQAKIDYEQSRSEKFHEEAEALKRMAKMKSAETHKSAMERVSE